MLYREIIAVCSEIHTHTKHKCTVWAQCRRYVQLLLCLHGIRAQPVTHRSVEKRAFEPFKAQWSEYVPPV